jgi:hypothetical protein
VPKRVIFNCVMQLLILIIGIVLTMSMIKVGKVSEQNTGTVSAIVEDWDKIPFVSVTVTDDKCLSNTESIFVREWKGT